MFDLDRFRRAQNGHPGYADAMRELQAGAKRSHWIWYVFPQLRGLGSSPMAVRYGLEGVDEATAYLRDTELQTKLARATEVVANQIAGGVSLEQLMGSEIDVLKLVSSMTLFGHIARAAHTREAPALGVVALGAEEILRAAATQGYPRCAFTEEQLGAA